VFGLVKSRTVVLALLLLLLGVSAWARGHHGGGHRHGAGHLFGGGRFPHDRQGPVLGAEFATLPIGAIAVAHGDASVYFHAGVWYRAIGSGFVVIEPPWGVVLPISPGCSPAQSSGPSLEPHYCYANGVYYQPMPTGSYRVVAPPQLALPQAAPAPSPVMEQGPASGSPFLPQVNDQPPGQGEAPKATVLPACRAPARGVSDANGPRVDGDALPACAEGEATR